MHIFLKWQYIHVHSTHDEFTSHFCPCFQEQVEERLGYPLEAVGILEMEMQKIWHAPKMGVRGFLHITPKETLKWWVFLKLFLFDWHRKNIHLANTDTQGLLVWSDRTKEKPTHYFSISNQNVCFWEVPHPFKGFRFNFWDHIEDPHKMASAQPPINCLPPKKVRRRWIKKWFCNVGTRSTPYSYRFIYLPPSQGKTLRISAPWRHAWCPGREGWRFPKASETTTAARGRFENGEDGTVLQKIY